MAIKDVIVKISLQKPITAVGFGIPLILATIQNKDVPYTECTNIEEVRALFPDTTVEDVTTEHVVTQAASLLFMQNDRPEKIAVCGTTKKATAIFPEIWNQDWRQLLIPTLGTDGEDGIPVISNYIEAQGDKLFFCSIDNYDDIHVTSGISCEENERTVVFFYDKEGAPVCPEAAIVGATAGLTAGSFTYKNMVIKGLTPLDKTDAEVTTMHNAGCITLLKKAGEIVTSEGITLGGEYIDVIDSQDWIIKDMEYGIQKTLIQLPKVPYDNTGIAILESQCATTLKRAFGMGIIAVNDEGLPAYATNFKKRSEVDAGDRTVRKYLGGSFTFDLAGAIHNVTINGTIVV